MIPSKHSADETTQPAETTTPAGDHGVVHLPTELPETPPETQPQEHKTPTGTEVGKVAVPYGQAVDKPAQDQPSPRQVDEANGVESNVPPTDDNGVRITTEEVDSILTDGVVPVDSVPVDVVEMPEPKAKKTDVTPEVSPKASPKMKRATADK